MDVIPVLDLLDGQVVRGVAGQREMYAPIESRLTGSSAPLAVAHSIRETFGLNRLYVADLDAIVHERLHWLVIERLVADGFELMVDAGLREPALARQLVDQGVTHVIAALETLPGFDQLTAILSEIESTRLVFSLDLMNGQAMARDKGWNGTAPCDIADQAIEAGVCSMIVLDLSGVGVGAGVPTLELCRRVMERHASCRIITGGGVRNGEDLLQAAKLGIDGLLIASALHDGSITAEDLARLSKVGPE